MLLRGILSNKVDGFSKINILNPAFAFTRDIALPKNYDERKTNKVPIQWMRDMICNLQVNHAIAKLNFVLLV